MSRTPQSFHFEDDSAFPNSSLPVLVYHEVPEAGDARRCERLFAQNDWRGAWQNGIYSFHHFHSVAHEVLGVVRGSATVIRGGPHGRELEINRGDVLVLPAGTGHCNLADRRLSVVGAYPNAMKWDICRAASPGPVESPPPTSAGGRPDEAFRRLTSSTCGFWVAVEIGRDGGAVIEHQ